MNIHTHLRAGIPTAVVRFNTDIPYLQPALVPQTPLRASSSPALPTQAQTGTKCILFGAGDICDAHGDNEHIMEEDLRQAVQTYYRIAQHCLDVSAE